MKIAIDLRPLQIGHQNRGIGTYLINLLQNLPERSDIRFIFLRYDHSEPIKDFDIQVNQPFDEVVFKKYRLSKKPGQLIKYVYNGLFPSYRPLKKYRPDVFFQTDYLLGGPRIFGCKIITVSFDLIPLKFKNLYLPHWTKFYRLKQLSFKRRIRLILKSLFYELKYQKGVKLLLRSEKVICISENTKRDLVELLNINEKKVFVIYAAASFRQNAQEATIGSRIKNELDNIKNPYLIFIGGTDPRRQVEELVYAFHLYNARQTPLDLVLCGNEFAKGSKKINPKAAQAIKLSSYASQIHRFGRVTEAEKKYALTRAAAFVYPTLYEGFGLPMLEAMDTGTPVISYHNSSLTEIGDDAVLYTEKEDGYAIYNSLVKLFSSRQLSENLSKKGRLRAGHFNWTSTSKEIWDLITSV